MTHRDLCFFQKYVKAYKCEARVPEVYVSMGWEQGIIGENHLKR